MGSGFPFRPESPGLPTSPSVKLKEYAESELFVEEEPRLSALRVGIQLGVNQLDSGESMENLDRNAFLAERHRNFDSRSAVR